MVKLRLNRRKIGEDVGMIELKIVQNCGARPVMHELRTLVEERGVVFVGLDHEKAGIRERGRNTEIDRHPTDEKARLQAGVFEYPGKHRRGTCLAVRSCDGEHPLLA